MLKNIEEIINKLKKDTNNCSDIIYRTKYVNNKKIYIIYSEPIVSSDKISDFIIRSLDYIDNKYVKDVDLISIIQNDITNFKVSEITTYKDLCFYLHNAFTIILIENSKTALALETRANIYRSISTPNTENTLRGPMDAFVENIQMNLGLIRRRIKSNNLWIKENFIGRYTDTKTCILYINGIADISIINKIDLLLKRIDIDGIINSGNIKNLIEKENKSVFSTIITTERPDKVSEALLNGKVAIIIDGCPFALILPSVINDYFKTPEDNFNKSINVSFTRIIRFVAFIITIFTPGIYIACITYNQEMLPTEFLINFASQRSSVPFPAFFEAILMALSFEILRESDLRMSNFASSALSIVGALILGEAAVNAGIVSPIMIIIISVTAITGFLFTEPEITNGIRWYRILFMIGASLMGIIGVTMVFIYFITKLCSLYSFGKPYLMPFTPFNLTGIKNSIIKLPIKKLNKREEYFSKNSTKYKEKKICEK